MLKKFKIGRFLVGEGCQPFIIAEMSGNHKRSLKRALKIVDEAAKIGVHAIKLQTYTADTITLNSKNKEFVINDKKSLWYKRNLYDLYQEAHTPWEWHSEIIKRAKLHNMICFSSPFDETAVDFLEKLNVPAYKIASFEINHIPLIRRVALTGKPIIISTGMASEKEIKEAVSVAVAEGAKKIILLKCTSEYPASVKDSNLNAIPYMQKKFKCSVGLSDHTAGLAAPIAAVALGACVIEKHITLNKEDGAVDSKFSLNLKDFKLLIDECKNTWLALGEKKLGPTLSEKKSLRFRRSIYTTKDLKKGDIITNKNIKVIRPSNGAHPKYFSSLIGQRINQNLKKNIPFKLSFLVKNEKKNKK